MSSVRLVVEQFLVQTLRNHPLWSGNHQRGRRGTDLLHRTSEESSSRNHCSHDSHCWWTGLHQHRILDQSYTKWSKLTNVFTAKDIPGVVVYSVRCFWYDIFCRSTFWRVDYCEEEGSEEKQNNKMWKQQYTTRHKEQLKYYIAICTAVSNYLSKTAKL